MLISLPKGKDDGTQCCGVDWFAVGVEIADLGDSPVASSCGKGTRRCNYHVDSR